MDIQQGRLSQAQWLASPNFNQRPDNTDISAIVIHNISLPPDEFEKETQAVSIMLKLSLLIRWIGRLTLISKP